MIKLVSADPQLTQLVRESGIPFSAIPPEALSNLAQPGAVQPQVLIVDLRQRSHFPPALALLKRQHPTTGVVLVIAQLDPALMLEAMRAGVNECVAEPLSVSELQAAMREMNGIIDQMEALLARRAAKP